MGKVKFKEGYSDLGAYPLLLHIIKKGGLEADGGAGLNTTLTDPVTFTDVDGNNLIIGNTSTNLQSAFVVTSVFNSFALGLVSIESNPFASAGFSVLTDRTTLNTTAAFEMISSSGVATYYKGIGLNKDGATGESTMTILCYTDSWDKGGTITFDDLAINSFMDIKDNDSCPRAYLFTVRAAGGQMFFGLTRGGKIQTDLPSYADNNAADADVNLPSKALYLLNGDRTVYQKP